jgi:hypothetical protein
MKNIFKSILTVFVAITMTSCEDESNLAYVNEAGDFRITSPTTNSSVVLNPDYPTNPALGLTWEAANFGTPTAVDYTVQVSIAGSNFADVTDVTSTNNTFASVNVEELNGAVVDAGLTPYTQGGVDIRIKATIGTNAEMTKYSSVITYLVTPYTTELPKLAVPGNHQGWNPSTAPRIAASGFGLTDYEGYVYLNGGHKFVGPDTAGNYNWGNTDWGDNGSFAGILAVTGESDCTATPGYYRVQANTTTLTYSETLTNWGIIGAATPGGWNTSTALTYNSTTKKWEGTIALTAGAFKFRANNAWTINLGGDSDQDGSMNYDGPDLTIATAGTYSVVLDLSNPRAYTYSIQ